MKLVIKTLIGCDFCVDFSSGLPDSYGEFLKKVAEAIKDGEVPHGKRRAIMLPGSFKKTCDMLSESLQPQGSGKLVANWCKKPYGNSFEKLECFVVDEPGYQKLKKIYCEYCNVENVEIGFTLVIRSNNKKSAERKELDTTKGKTEEKETEEFSDKTTYPKM